MENARYYGDAWNSESFTRVSNVILHISQDMVIIHGPAHLFRMDDEYGGYVEITKDKALAMINKRAPGGKVFINYAYDRPYDSLDLAIAAAEALSDRSAVTPPSPVAESPRANAPAT